jgi:NAD(P)-dependent dehydrogenase (short-subunit alcohol dehydrogenase family)
MDLQLAGKVALVTGSSRGTGEAIAKGLAAEGALVIVHGPTVADAAPVAEAIRAAGGQAHVAAGDIATDAGGAEIAAAALAPTGAVDILVNNYGTTSQGAWLETPSEDWIAIYEKNTLSAARMIRALVPAMRARGWGRVIQIGTIGSTRPGAGMPHYYASKGALANMTVSLAQELAGTGITVNIVSPGLIRTREVEAAYRKRAAREGWGEDWGEIEACIAREIMPNLVGRIARTEEVADLVAFLASPRAGYLTGINIRIDGGALPIVG